MSRKRRPSKSQKFQNSLTDLTTMLKVQYGSMTGGSVLSSYGTQAFSNNYALVTLNRIILTYMYTTNGIFQTAVQLPIQDGIGKGIDIHSGELDNDDIDQIHEYWEEKSLWSVILNTMTWVRLFGGGALLLNSNQSPEKPINYKTLHKTPIDFYDLDRWQLDTNIVLFDDWSTYLKGSVNGDTIYYNGVPIHESRFIKGSGKRAPSYVRHQLRGWGMSEAERMLRDLNLYLKTQDVLFEILDESKVDIYHIQGLANKLMTSGGTSKILTRVQAANEIKNYVNALVLDEKEGFESKQLAFNGLAEVMNQNRIGVAAALRMPLTKLFGLSASGFNTGESDLENYNQMLESEIRVQLSPIVRQVLKIVMAHIFGYVPSFRFEWKPLRELSAKEQAEIGSSQSQVILDWFDRGLLTSEEAMQEAKQKGLIEIDTKAEKGMVEGTPKPEGEPETEDFKINNYKNTFRIINQTAGADGKE